jgi:hypothetical protein
LEAAAHPLPSLFRAMVDEPVTAVAEVYYWIGAAASASLSGADSLQTQIYRGCCKLMVS